MYRLLAAFLMVAGFAFLPVAAQAQSSTTDATALANFAPQDNAGGGSVSARAPGTWVRGALARHNGLKGLRLNGPRFGQPNTEEAQLRFGQSSSSASSGTSGFDFTNLLNLFNQAGGVGALANLGNSDLTNLLGGLAGNTGGSATTGGSTTTGTDTTGGMTADQAAALQNLIALGQSAGSGTAKANNRAAQSDSTQTQTRSGYTFGGAIARLPKPEQRFQATTTQPSAEPGFKVRFATAMAETFFNAVALAMSTPQFVQILKDALQPLVLPPSSNSGSTTDGTSGGSTDGSSGGSTDGSSGGSTDGSSGGSSSGSGGIENLSPPTDGGSSGGTV